MLTLPQIKRKLKESTQAELAEWLYETAKSSKELQAYVSVKLEGEAALLEILDASKEKIHKEFYPTRGLPRLRVAKVGPLLSEMKRLGKDTIQPFELLLYFCEVAVQYIHEEGDIFEDMGDLFSDSYEEVIQMLNEVDTADLFEQYKDRVKAIVNTSNCEYWGIHDSLEGSYSVLKWADHDEAEYHVDQATTVISYAAMGKWLKIPDFARQQFIGNVWCTRCADVTNIKEFSVKEDKHGIVLEGICSKCLHPVARVIEDN